MPEKNYFDDQPTEILKLDDSAPVEILKADKSRIEKSAKDHNMSVKDFLKSIVSHSKYKNQ